MGSAGCNSLTLPIIYFPDFERHTAIINNGEQHKYAANHTKDGLTDCGRISDREEILWKGRKPGNNLDGIDARRHRLN